MRNTNLCAFMLAACLLIATPSSVFSFGGYKDLLWIDQRGYTIHVLADGSTTLTSFLRYRQIRFEDDTRLPGHFLCTHENIRKEIPVRDIKSIKLRLSVEQFGASPRNDRLQQLVLTTRDGQSFDVTVDKSMGFSLANDSAIQFKYYDPIQQRFTFGSISGDSLREIHFH
jgi:hypothetical protein